MQQIVDMFKNLGTSEPVFKVSTKYDNKYAMLEVLQHYMPNILQDDDPVLKVVKEHYSESFDKQKLKFVAQNNATSVYGTLMYRITKAYSSAMQLKNPRASKIAKWLTDMGYKYNDQYADGFIALYRYICLHTNYDFVFTSKTDQHAVNFVAILEKMRVKYEARP